MSWGASGVLSETAYDSYFTTPAGHIGITFVASSGDGGAGTTWPSVSPNVLRTSVGHHAQHDRVRQLRERNRLERQRRRSEHLRDGTQLSNIGRKHRQAAPLPMSPTMPTRTRASCPSMTPSRTPDRSAGLKSVERSALNRNEMVGDPDCDRPTRGVGQPTLAPLSNANSLVVFCCRKANSTDITSGSNGYPATTGYDLVTGRGSPVLTTIMPCDLTKRQYGRRKVPP